MSWDRLHIHSVGPRPSHTSFTAWFSCLRLRGNSSSLGTNVTIPGHLSHQVPLACEETPSIDLGIMKLMSTWIFIILIKYRHIGSQRRWVPTQFWTRRPCSEGGVGGVGPNRMKMQPIPRDVFICPLWHNILYETLPKTTKYRKLNVDLVRLANIAYMDVHWVPWSFTC